MNSSFIKTGFFITVAGIVSKLAYLIVEAYYNNLLLEFAGSGDFTEQQANNIQQFGHALAGVGMTLALLGVLYPFIKRVLDRRTNHRTGTDKPTNRFTTLLYRVVMYSIITITVFTITYKGQELLIDHLVSKADNTLRHDAYYLNMLRSLLARGDIQHTGIIPSRTNEKLSFEDKLVLAEIPIVIFDDSGLIDRMKKNAGVALRGFAREKAYRDNFAKHWEQYRAYQKDVINLWKVYQQTTQKLRKEFNNEDKKVRELRQAYLDSAKQAYPSYAELNNVVVKSIQERLNKHNIGVLHGRLKQYFNESNYFTRSETYASTMKAVFGYVVKNPKQTWCDGVLCPGNHTFIKKQAARIFSRQFKSRTGGISYGINSYDEFINNGDVISTLLNRSSKNKVAILNPALLSSSTESFMGIYHYTLANSVTDALRTITKDATLQIKAGLNSDIFIHDPDVVAFLEKKVPKKLRGIPLLLDKNTFFDQYWRKKIDAAIEREVTKYLPAGPETFVHPTWTTRGDKAVKLMYVIPIALIFSAALFMANAILLIFSLLNLLPIKVSLSRPVKTVIMISLLMLPLSIPVTVQDNRAAVTQYMKHLKATNPVAMSALSWLNHSESVAYLSGKTVNTLLPETIQARLDDYFGITRSD